MVFTITTPSLPCSCVRRRKEAVGMGIAAVCSGLVLCGVKKGGEGQGRYLLPV